MPIQLDRILSDIAEEKALHPNFAESSKKDVEDAWVRVGKSNKLSVHEARSIFKVLQKKYDQERNKGTSSWKLFSIMEEIHRKEVKPPAKEEDADFPVEEDEEYEMLEVQEEDEHAAAAAAQQPLPAHSSGSASDNDSPSKSLKSNSSTGSPEKDEKPLIKTIAQAAKQAAIASTTTTTNATNSPTEEKKLLNTMASATPRPPAPSAACAVTPQSPAAATAVALQKKGITMKKTTPTTPTSARGNHATQIKTTPMRAAAGGGHLLEVGKTIQLPESIKRKLSEDHTAAPQNKKINTGHSPKTSSPLAAAAQAPPQQQQHTTTTQLMQVKQEREDLIAAAREKSNAAAHSHAGINLITIPANPTRADLLTNGGGGDGVGGGPTSSTAATVASTTTSTNGFSPRIEEIDFRNDIIFDSGISSAGCGGGGGSAINGNSGASKITNTNATEIINLGNYDNSLPPTFFKNLCNSSRHEALGLYVANVMNRLRARSAAKLELGILRAIIDVQSDDLELQ